MDIEITFINQSHDSNNSHVVIFQKNVAAGSEETVVAWRVLENVGHNWTHKFKFPINSYIAVQDSWGNVSPLQPVQNGQKWDLIQSTSGDILTLDSSPASTMNAIEMKNCLSVGAVDAQIYKDGKLLATKTGVSPQQKAVFEFTPTLWVGVVAELEEGAIMNSAVLADINTEISLLGITRANLIMTGGGVGSTAVPFMFTLVPTG